MRLLGFEFLHRRANVGVLIATLQQCRVLRQCADHILRVNGARVLRSAAGKFAEAVRGSLLIELLLQGLHLLQGVVQVGRLLGAKGGKPLLGDGQLLLQRFLPRAGGGTVTPCQRHYGVHLCLGQPVDGSQILTLHRFLPLGYGGFTSCRGLPNPPDTARRRRSYAPSVARILLENVTGFSGAKTRFVNRVNQISHRVQKTGI